MQILYDFLFVDQERMRSLYAQLYEGLLDAMSFDNSLSKLKERGFQVGGEPVGNYTKNTAEGFSESKNEGLVPHDLVLRDVLAGLNEKNMIVKNYDDIRNGSIALIQGGLTVLDPRIFLNFIKDFPHLMTAPDINACKESQTRTQKKKDKKESKKTIDILEAMFSLVTPIIQLRIDGDEAEVWAAIKEDNMRAGIDNLIMQHGCTIPGKWNILGIIDDSGKNDDDESVSRPLPEIFDGLTEAMSALKDMFKRPACAICVTPLVVYRTLCSE